MKQDSRHSIRKICAFILYVVCIVFVISFAVNSIKSINDTENNGISIGGYWPVIVVTGSMLPEIQINSINICKTATIDELEVGNIVVYKYNDMLITHRVIEITSNSSGEKILHTKGDANESPDSLDITADMVKGQVVATWNGIAPILSKYMIAPGELNSLAIAQTLIWLFVTIGLLAFLIHWLCGFISMLIKASIKDDAYDKELDTYIDDINDLLKYREILFKLRNCELKDKEHKYSRRFNRIARARAMREIRTNSESVKDFNKAMKHVITYNKLGVYLDQNNSEDDIAKTLEKNKRKQSEKDKSEIKVEEAADNSVGTVVSDLQYTSKNKKHLSIFKDKKDKEIKEDKTE